MRARRRIAAELAETAAAADISTRGNIVLDVLVDDPAFAGDSFSVYAGEIMLEAASATDVVVVGGDISASIDEARTATDLVDGAFPIPGPRTIFLTSGTTWIVPSDWNNADNIIECIGGGGGAGSGGPGLWSSNGGGGGAYATISNITLTPLASIAITVGQGGAGATTANASGANGTATNFNGGQCVAVAGAGGTSGTAAGGTAGGAAAS